MRIPHSIFTTGRLVLIMIAVIGSVVLLSAPKSELTVNDKAYYLDANQASFVRPGLVIKIVSVDIAADGTIKARYKLTDPKGLPLDRDGIVTPGAVSTSFVISSIPKGQTQYLSYITRTETDDVTKRTVDQATSDSGGTFEKVADGEYIYTFKFKLPAGFDKSATHSVGAYGSRTLAEFDLPNNFDSNVFTFVPDGSKVSVTRDVVKTESCNRCHDQLSFHGGSRRGVEMCVLCHNTGTTDAQSGNSLDFKVFIHKIHAGEELPSVKAGGKYVIVGRNLAVSDFSTVVFPADVRNCQFCHEQGKGAAQETAFLKPNRAACGSCHDDVNFATGENHVNLPQASDNSCATCHTPKGELEFDASIMGAHLIPEKTATVPGLVLDILKVENGTAGNKPTVTFTIRDKAGNAIPLDQMVATPNRVGLVLAGPTSDYGYTGFGSDVTTHGYVAENPVPTAKCSNDGTCTYTFAHAIPAEAKGTFSIGIEGRRGITFLPGTKKELASEYGAINKVVYFSVDGSPVAPRRKVVDINNCNNRCHSSLSMHGENRNRIEQCVQCHNPSETDIARRPTATDVAERSQPPQGVNFAVMIHKIHTGENMKEYDRGFTVIGFGGSVNDFSEVRFPAMSPTGAVGERRNCSLCHVNGSEQLPLQGGRNMMTDPQGYINPVGPITAACTGCHMSQAAASHAMAQTSDKLGESCEVCHGKDAEFAVSKVHAR